MKNEFNNTTEAFGQDNESLGIFLRGMKKFDVYFCELMAGGHDFTLKMEIHGNKGKMIHCRVQNDGFERPKWADSNKSKMGKGNMGRNI